MGYITGIYIRVVPQESFVVLFKKCTPIEHIEEVLGSVMMKYNKRVVCRFKVIIDPALRQEGIPIQLVIRGKNILNIRKDLMLNPRVSRLIDLGA